LSIDERESKESFFAEFLDDYFAESEEHLMQLRRGLLALERFVNQPQVDRPLLDELFRSFHSLKGISGMVGVREAEQLAHEMESYLRALRQGQAMLTQEGCDGLVAGTKMLEQVIAARRVESPTPDIAPILAQLESIIADEASPAKEKISGVAVKTWRAEFLPTPELAARGVNVNTVRAQLQNLGELKSGAPRVMPGGGVAFEFVVMSGADESAFAALAPYGLNCELIAEPASPAAESGLAETFNENKAQPAPAVAPANIVRVSLSRLDELMRMVGELVISRARLDDNLKTAEPDMPASQWRALQETNLMMERQLRDMREAVMRVRMVPVGEIFERMRFVVRDLAREYQKKVRLEISGQGTEIDKLLIERMTDPLMHLVRNAISHGLESAAEREAAGKSEEGIIALRAFTAAEMVVIEIEDDGRGIDRERVAERARSTGLNKGLGTGLFADNAKLDDAALLELICAPGFSTRDEADRASGRGVGMAVVKETVSGLGGTFALRSEAGRGTKFIIELPVTLAIADALIVSVGGQRFAVPQSSIREVLEIEPASIRVLENNEIVHYRGGVLPIVRLGRLFELDEKYERALHAFVTGTGESAVGIAVDRILGQREIVVRAINDPLIQVEGIAGATELGDGRVVLILDAAALVKQTSARRGRPA
jgi:two-component system chemotaxis sensor kinase CheA